MGALRNHPAGKSLTVAVAGQPNTGDPSGVALLPLAGLGVLALAGAGACLAKRRRTR